MFEQIIIFSPSGLEPWTQTDWALYSGLDSHLLAMCSLSSYITCQASVSCFIMGIMIMASM